MSVVGYSWHPGCLVLNCLTKKLIVSYSHSAGDREGGAPSKLSRHCASPIGIFTLFSTKLHVSLVCSFETWNLTSKLKKTCISNIKVLSYEGNWLFPRAVFPCCDVTYVVI